MLMLEIVIVFVTGILTASFIIPMAEAERGYKAIGSEWLLVVLTMTIVIYLVNKFLNK